MQKYHIKNNKMLHSDSDSSNKFWDEYVKIIFKLKYLNKYDLFWGFHVDGIREKQWQVQLLLDIRNCPQSFLLVFAHGADDGDIKPLGI